MSAGVLAPRTNPSTKFANHLTTSSAGRQNPPHGNPFNTPFQAMKKVIGISLESELDAEAYASRIERDPRFKAIVLTKKAATTQEHARIDLLLSDRCPRIEPHFNVSKVMETGKQLSSIDKVVRLPKHLTNSCNCCHRAVNATEWSHLLSFVSKVLEINSNGTNHAINSTLGAGHDDLGAKQAKRPKKLTPAARLGLPSELDSLTRREIDILQLVGRGLSVKEMAKQLKLAESTIGNHKYRLMRKLNVASSLGLLRIAVRCGLSELWDSPPEA